MIDHMTVVFGPLSATGSGRAGIGGAILVLIIIVVWAYAQLQFVL
jgi:hypothetical protein